MRTRHWVVVVVLAILVTGVVAPQVAAMRKPPATAATPIGTIRELMEGIVDPASDVLFESVATVSSAAGVVEVRPTTDEDWARVEHNALMLAEAANLLTMSGRHVANPGDPEPQGQPDSPELTAPQVEAKIGADQALWIKYANGLRDSAIEARTAARGRSVEGLFAVGDKIDRACENCHLEYWYPNEKKPGAGQ
jgi:hypothetical protein